MYYVYILFHFILLIFISFQVGTGDEFLDNLLATDPGLEDGAVPDLKVQFENLHFYMN